MEWYVEIAVRFAGPTPVQTRPYTERMDRFEDLLSEYLGGRFEPSMIGFADRLETYAYVEADGREEAAALALRPFRESAEAVWGPGTTAEVSRVVTSEERDRELDLEGAGDDIPEDEWLAAMATNPALGFLADPREDVYGPEDGEPFDGKERRP